MLKQVTFVGNPNDPRDARHTTQAFGEIYVVNQPRNVNLTEAVLKKLEGNSHFEVKDPRSDTLTDRLAATAESHALANDPPPEQSADDPGAHDFTQGAARRAAHENEQAPPPEGDDPEPITVRRARPKNRSAS